MPRAEVVEIGLRVPFFAGEFIVIGIAAGTGLHAAIRVIVILLLDVFRSRW